jgi:hypothetical protein
MHEIFERLPNDLVKEHPTTHDGNVQGTIRVTHFSRIHRPGLNHNLKPTRPPHQETDVGKGLRVGRYGLSATGDYFGHAV